MKATFRIKIYLTVFFQFFRFILCLSFDNNLAMRGFNFKSKIV